MIDGKEDRCLEILNDQMRIVGLIVGLQIRVSVEDEDVISLLDVTRLQDAASKILWICAKVEEAKERK